MKKIFGMFAVLLLMLTTLSVAFAQDSNTTVNQTVENNTSVSNNTEVHENTTSTTNTATETNQSTEPSDDTKDVSTMTDKPGVTLRVTQLQERIERAVVNGNAVISQLSAKGNVSVSGLQSIVDQLKALETQAGQIDVNQDVSASTAQFVSIKKQAIDLVKQFRDKVRALVPPGQRDELRKKAKDSEKDALKDIRQKVEDARKLRNKQVFADIATRLGVDLGSIASQLQAGTISIEDAKKAIKQAFSGLSADKKAAAKQKLQESVSEFRVKKLANLERIKGNIQGREQKAESNNRTKLDARLKNMEGRVDTRIQNVENRQNKNSNSTGGNNE